MSTLAQELEARIKALEAFHHWATTQVFPKLDDHETILARIERRLAELNPQTEKPSEQERLMQTLQHIAGHPPFTSQVVLDERPLADPNRHPVRMPDYEH